MDVLDDVSGWRFGLFVFDGSIGFEFWPLMNVNAILDGSS